jgi:diguanylate cyclase (GGDEF)-like protein
MLINVLRFLKVDVAPILSRRVPVVLKTPARAKPRKACPEELPCVPEQDADRAELETFQKIYSPFRLFGLLACTITACVFLIKNIFIRLPGLSSAAMLVMASVLLITGVFSVLYAFFYTPMAREFNKLRKIEVAMRKLAFIDVLTGLYNRRGFLTYAQQLLRSSDHTQDRVILIYAGLDNIKQINDDLGHVEGDRALAAIADVLKHTFRPSDVIGRVGGDEFAVLALEAKAESLDALRIRMNENFKRTQYSVNSTCKVTFSLGILYYDPEKPQAIEALLKRADELICKDRNFGSNGSPLMS